MKDLFKNNSIYTIIFLLFTFSCSDTGLNFTESDCYEASHRIPTWLNLSLTRN